VALTDALVTRGHLELTRDAGLVTDAGIALFARIGINLTLLTAGGGKTTRVLCRPCLDWSERRPHLAGAVGAALCARSFEEGWIRRLHGTRAVAVTPKGHRIFRDTIGVRLDV
ncbi:MAG TPA: transcriptional regulator, partial [Burkholderiales bacterium]|nr:transcriptional regulator [Burkholderiales bacterium]